jgi:hypothetical protein
MDERVRNAHSFAIREPGVWRFDVGLPESP